MLKRYLEGIFSIQQFSQKKVFAKKAFWGISSTKQFSKRIFGHFQYQTIFKETFRDRMRPVKQQLCQVGLTDDLQLQIANCKWDDLQKHLLIEKKTRISNHYEQNN